MSDKENGEEAEPTIANDMVVTKYTMAAEIVNDVLKELMSQCIEDKSVIELCEFGDKQLIERTSKVFRKDKEMKKGIAFPTCVSVNNCICHFSPLRSEPDVKLKTGDVVKIDLGAHIDGFCSVCAHTVVVGASKTAKVVGRKADAILAGYNCLEAAIRMLRPGQHKNVDITETIQKIAENFHCKAVENMLSFQLKKNQIGNEEDIEAKQIIQNPTDEQKQKIKKCEFEQHEVYAIDILISTGEGKSREQDTRPTVYKHKNDLVYQLKLKASRTFFSEVHKRFGDMPFSLRSLDDEKKARMGIVECERHDLMKPFKVYYEREGEFVVQFKATVLIMPTALLKITGPILDEEMFKSEYSVEDQMLKQLIISSLKPAKKKNKKKTATNEVEDEEKKETIVISADGQVV